MDSSKKPEPTAVPVSNKKPEPTAVPVSKKPEPTAVPVSKKPEPTAVPAPKKPEPAAVPVSKKPEPTAVPVEQKESYKTEQIFDAVRETAEQWFKIPKDSKTEEMDSVNFHNDRFELIVDARGYAPQDLKCVINPLSVEIVAHKTDMTGNRTFSTSRNYEFNSSVNPSKAVCCLSAEGLLLVAAPWVK